MGSCISSDPARTPRASSASASALGAPLSPSPGSKRWRGSKRRPPGRSSSVEHRGHEVPLHRIPGRMFLNGSTHLAAMFTQQGKKGTNQDAMIVWENFGSRTDTVFCGVFDGHGPYGHMVAKRVRDSLPLKLSAHWEVNLNSSGGGEVLKEISLNSTVGGGGSPSANEEQQVSAAEAEKRPDICQTLKDSFLKAFRVMDRELRVQGTIDCFCSGSTAVTLVKQGQDVVIGNVGDSRAVLATRDKDGFLVPIQLTVDLKPNLPEEAERIRKCRGRVFALQDEPEVARVWLPNNDSPGLAMARAFGDFCLKDFGLIAVPEISYRRITDKDEFIVLATDGVWDVLSNKEVIEVVATSPSRSSSSRAIVETAVRAWRHKYPTSKVDDCAAVCLFLDSDTNNISTAGSTPRSKEDATLTNNVNSTMEKEDDPTCPSGLDSAGTLRTDQGTIHPQGSKEDLLEQPDSEEFKDWSALEGVSRVNTLLTLPRFVPGKDGKMFGK